jgi:hypothetical protein
VSIAETGFRNYRRKSFAKDIQCAVSEESTFVVRVVLLSDTGSYKKDILSEQGTKYSTDLAKTIQQRWHLV